MKLVLNDGTEYAVDYVDGTSSEVIEGKIAVWMFIRLAGMTSEASHDFQSKIVSHGATTKEE